MQLPSLSKTSKYRARNFLAASVFYLQSKGLVEAQKEPRMNLGRVVRRSLLAGVLGSVFAIGGFAQPASAVARYGVHRDIQSDRRDLRQDFRMRNRVNRDIGRRLRQLRRSNQEFGRDSFRSRMLRRRIRRDLRERYVMNRDIRQDRRETWRDRHRD